MDVRSSPGLRDRQHSAKHAGMPKSVLRQTEEMDEEEMVGMYPPLSSHQETAKTKTIHRAALRRHNADPLLTGHNVHNINGDSIEPTEMRHKKHRVRHHDRRHHQQFRDSSHHHSSMQKMVWDRNLSNLKITDKNTKKNEAEEDEADLADKQKQYSAIRKLEVTALWLRPLAFLWSLLNKLFCSYTLHIEFHSRLASALKDPTKMLRQNLSGLFFGILVGFVSYVLFLVTFSQNPRLSTLLSAYVMLASVFGIAFSSDFRCVALLTIPYLAASRVRWLLMLYASSLSITGPGLNFLHNSGNFRNAIACVLAQVSTNMMLLQKLTAAPFSLLRSQLESLINSLNQTLNKIRFSLHAINLALFKVTNVMTQQSSWVRSLVDSCGNKVALQNQCLSFFNNVYFNCLQVTTAALCGFVRQFAADTCSLSLDFTHLCDKQAELLESQLNITSTDNLTRQVDDILNLLGRKNLTLQGNFDGYEKLTIESDDTVVSILQKRMDTFVSTVEHGKYVLAWILVIWTLLTMLQLVIQAAIFRKAWVSSDTFDNHYITPAFVEQEKRALQQGLVPTVPLIRGEKREYKKFSSMFWTNSEKKKASRSIIILFLWMLSLGIVLFTDYAMYQVLITIMPVFSTNFASYGSGARLGKEYEPEVTSTVTKPEIRGDSSYANVIRAMVSMLNPIKDIALDVDAEACRPIANPPDDSTNITVAVMMVMTLFSIFFEVYILRLRHIIMIWYYPSRGVQRAAWLRTHIRNNRGMFHRLIHKFRTMDLRPPRRTAKVSRLGKMMVRSPLLRRLLEMVGVKRIMCSFCGQEGNPSKKVEFSENFIQCVECGSHYCKPCQVDLDSICMVCRTPLFALAVEVDFEQLSSEEEFEAVCARYLRRANQTTVKSKTPGVSDTRLSVDPIRPG
ncbi:DC-STAMP domain-containing protein 2 [Fasciola hepatica]|uniref:DC-STAMP domain-containing protein 2 n=1 Tax=Fasciola hepatica TaxID=6192 RepID=A0A4E0RLY7_FASHE|nr:DC-STAMP domain-containing protein 2 [Fasciola hepatica]